MTNTTPLPGNDTGTPDLDDMIAHASRLSDLIEASTDLFDHLPNSGMQAAPFQQRHLGALLYTLKESADLLVAGLETVQRQRGN